MPADTEPARRRPALPLHLFRLPRLLAAGLLGACLLGAGTVWAADPPAWESLTPAQRQVLAPLQREWPQIDGARKAKWLEVAARYPTMPAEDRERLQQRMAAWARMTPAERASARLQFQETRALPREQKQSRWEAYQALPEDERRRLAQSARPAARPADATPPGPRAVGAVGNGSTGAGGTNAAGGSTKSNLVQARPAPPARTVAPALLTARPGATTTTVTTPARPPVHHQPGLPKIAATPGFVDQATLLPQRGPQGAAVRGPAASAPAGQP